MTILEQLEPLISSYDHVNLLDGYRHRYYSVRMPTDFDRFTFAHDAFDSTYFGMLYVDDFTTGEIWTLFTLEYLPTLHKCQQVKVTPCSNYSFSQLKQKVESTMEILNNANTLESLYRLKESFEC